MINPQIPIQVTVPVPKPLYDRLSERAKAMNIRAAEYVRRLFEAGYMARVADEKGQPSGDAALDQAVRAVFLMAGAEPARISEAVGVSERAVARILEGWKRVLSGEAAPAVEAPIPPAGPASAPDVPPHARPAPPEGLPRKNSYTAAEIETIREMWAQGRTPREIGARLGRSDKAVSQFSIKNRDICPRRRA